MKNLTENNTLIGLFMGGYLSSVPNLINLPQTMGEAKIHCVKGAETLPNGTYSVHRLNELEYHKNWNWLIPVIKQIREVINTELDISDYFDLVGISQTLNPYDYTIEQIYNHSVEAIKKINQIKKDLVI